MTIEYLGTWEQIYNPAFKVVEFDHFKQERFTVLKEIAAYQLKVLTEAEKIGNHTGEII